MGIILIILHYIEERVQFSSVQLIRVSENMNVVKYGFWKPNPRLRSYDLIVSWPFEVSSKLLEFPYLEDYNKKVNFILT